MDIELLTCHQIYAVPRKILEQIKGYDRPRTELWVRVAAELPRSKGGQALHVSYASPATKGGRYVPYLGGDIPGKYI